MLAKITGAMSISSKTICLYCYLLTAVSLIGATESENEKFLRDFSILDDNLSTSSESPNYLVQNFNMRRAAPIGIGPRPLNPIVEKRLNQLAANDGLWLQGSSNQVQRQQVLDKIMGLGSRQAVGKRATAEGKTCPPTKPFLCPSSDPQTGECIPIQYLCDGSNDCPAYSTSPGGYDEDPLLCTAVKRPPVEETANFLRTLLTNHGPEYVGKLFGAKMSQALMPLGGPERVAIALSVSKTIEDFGKALHLMRGDIDHLREVLVAVQTADGPMLKNLGIVRNSELADMKFFLEKLLSTGFLD